MLTPALSHITLTARDQVFVGLSGGVDSAVTAMLLCQQPCQVTGVFMKNWEEDDTPHGTCPASADLEDAQRICAHLRIPLRTVNFSAEYWDHVFADCLKQLQMGLTPNPDVLCNREIKFKLLLQYAQQQGARFIATGHYAQRWGQAPHLHQAADPHKDQTYFLCQVTQDALRHVLFPLGAAIKSQVRAAARAAGLPVHNKPDSTGICFIGPKRFQDFVSRYVPCEPGPIQTPEGQVLGQHRGLPCYTLGQRHGLGIGGLALYPNATWYVADKHTATRTLVVVPSATHPLLYARIAHVPAMHWIGAPPPDFPCQATAKIRHQQPEQAVTVQRDPSGFHVHFQTTQRAVTPGQYLVLYQGARCLGGGMIAGASR